MYTRIHRAKGKMKLEYKEGYTSAMQVLCYVRKQWFNVLEASLSCCNTTRKYSFYTHYTGQVVGNGITIQILAKM